MFALCSSVVWAQLNRKDTLESGSSDSIYTPVLDKVPEFIVVTFIQLDTNATNPDSILVEQGDQTGQWVPIGFRKSSTDSILFVIPLHYDATGLPQFSSKISGWIWQPYVPRLRFRMSNLYYLSNRRVLVSVNYI